MSEWEILEGLESDILLPTPQPQVRSFKNSSTKV